MKGHPVEPGFHIYLFLTFLLYVMAHMVGPVRSVFLHVFHHFICTFSMYLCGQRWPIYTTSQIWLPHHLTNIDPINQFHIPQRK
ncbi:hypothetical protein P168DRAFT_190201 [Aspergillus campestris IBT 28561]|uniref:Uncharacterized protein n=1 Tax=Aspergillus campestris (strain IBT 28561) TaxID=1392248 RepID=A0A2I1CYK2_ASPC2|nr:uncharacterized protein P168DRAFT_190201 [Aspergillus campestris IBT 28561]PKY02703.1 hypothetical protein P168DRAFT_190201 [Aspergillus campestris IBT 28561]